MEGETITAKTATHTYKTTMNMYNATQWIRVSGWVQEWSENAAEFDFRRSQMVRKRVLYKDTVRYSWVEVMPWHEKE